MLVLMWDNDLQCICVYMSRFAQICLSMVQLSSCTKQIPENHLDSEIDIFQAVLQPKEGKPWLSLHRSSLKNSFSILREGIWQQQKKSFLRIELLIVGALLIKIGQKLFTHYHVVLAKFIYSRSTYIAVY